MLHYLSTACYMRKSLHHLLLILLLFSTNLILAQQATFNKVEFPVGSFSGLVGGIAQDNNGYVWLATKGGLYRYDGYRFEMYANDPSDPHSISTMNVENVYADPNGIIWVVTYVNGVDRLDPTTGKFTHFRHQPNDPGSLSSDTVRAILVDREGTLWIGTHRGLDRYDPKAGNFKHYQHDPDDPNSLSCNQVRKIYEDKQGTLWVGTGSVWRGEGGETDEGGLNSFNKETGKFIRYLNDPDNPHSLISNKVQAIFEDSRGTFWVGTAGDGLHSLNRRDGTFHRHLYEPANPQGLSRPPVNENLTLPDHITFITEDALGSVWIGTLGNGLNRYDPEIGMTEHYTTDINGFMENSAWASCNSKDGILWISTWGGELYLMDPYRKNISRVSTPSPVVAFSEDAADQLWIGTSQGLVVKNMKSNVSKTFVHDPSNQNSLSDNFVRHLFRDREGILWVGTTNGLNRFNAQYNTFTRWQNSPGDSSSISAGIVLKITEAGDNFLWIGTSFGLDLMNKRTGTFTHFKNKANNTSSLSRNIVTSLLNDPSGNLWVGTALAGGLNYFERKTGVFKHFLKGKSIYSLFQDSGGVVWVGTDDGLYWTNNPVNGFTRFTDPGSGMESAQVGSIQEDDRKNIWVRTPAGIYRINLLSNQSTFFALNVRISIRENDFGLFSLRNGYKGKNGEFYFGDANGYSVFFSEQVHK